MKHVYVTGGCGYKGSVLVPKLLKNNYYVTVLDTQWFGNYLEDHKNLNVIKGDVRDIDCIDLNNVDTIIHLSSVANDPCGDLNPKLTWEISALATMQLMKKHQIKKYLNLSTLHQEVCMESVIKKCYRRSRVEPNI